MFTSVLRRPTSAGLRSYCGRPAAGGQRRAPDQRREGSLHDHIKLDADESDAVIGCLVRAAEVGEGTGNLDLMAMAEHLVDLIIEKWLKRGDADA